MKATNFALILLFSASSTLASDTWGSKAKNFLSSTGATLSAKSKEASESIAAGTNKLTSGLGLNRVDLNFQFTAPASMGSSRAKLAAVCAKDKTELLEKLFTAGSNPDDLLYCSKSLGQIQSLLSIDVLRKIHQNKEQAEVIKKGLIALMERAVRLNGHYKPLRVRQHFNLCMKAISDAKELVTCATCDAASVDAFKTALLDSQKYKDECAGMPTIPAQVDTLIQKIKERMTLESQPGFVETRGIPRINTAAGLKSAIDKTISRSLLTILLTESDSAYKSARENIEEILKDVDAFLHEQYLAAETEFKTVNNGKTIKEWQETKVYQDDFATANSAPVVATPPAAPELATATVTQ